MPKRLHSLDTLRGLAALIVVVWHWQHFFSVTQGTPLPGWQPEWEPLFPVFKAAYFSGWMAVDLFFVLSGFVFAWLYAEEIAEQRITPGRFALLRFSRLYPLHLLTLLVVVALQWNYNRATGGYFVYHANDLPHFLASLVLAQNWAYNVQTFNGPSWSVSTEMLVYIVFFMVARTRLLHWTTCIAMMPIGFATYHFQIMGDLGRGTMGFFAGVIAFNVTRFIRSRPDAARISRFAMFGAGLAWIVAVGQFYWPGLASLLGEVSVLPRQEIPLLLFVVLVGIPTVMALALHEQVLGGRYQRFSFLGDISYSTYLLHFPMQLLLANIAVRLGWLPADFMSPVVMIAFYTSLIVLGSITYRYFERPMQALIRGQSRSRFAPQPDQII